jgi:serine/threonine protein kinase
MAAEEIIKISGFDNLTKIGEGGNSLVFAGTRVKDKHPVVLKVKRTSNINANANVVVKVANRLYGLKEYDIGNYFNCDFIAKYLSYSSVKNYTYTIMDREQSSMTIYKKGNILPFQEKVSLLKKLLYGLHECHQDGVLHLDMKFENVLLRARERQGIMVDEPLITDFGFSLRVRSVKSGAKMTRKFGTTGYYAPEQHSAYYPRDRRGDYKIFHGSADIWAYGIIAYRLLTENRVYNSNNNEEIYIDMTRYFRDGTVAELIKRRKYPSIIALDDEDKADVIELLSALLTWDHTRRPNTTQLLNLPIFRKSAKLTMNCELKRPYDEKFYINPNSKILPYCLDYINDVAMTCPGAQIIIYYHMVDLVYRICSHNLYSILDKKYARQIVVICMIIAIDYHYYTEIDGLLEYIRDIGFDHDVIVTKAAEYAAKLNHIMYRRYLYETARTLEDIDHHVRDIIPDINAYRDQQFEIVDSNAVDYQTYDEPIVAYVTIGDVVGRLL